MSTLLRFQRPAMGYGFIYSRHGGSTHSPVAAYAVVGVVAVFVIGFFVLRALRGR